MPFFVFFRSLRKKLQFTVFLDHVVVTSDQGCEHFREGRVKKIPPKKIVRKLLLRHL